MDVDSFVDTYGLEFDKSWLRLKSRPPVPGEGGDACIFLGEDNRCTIYEARPLQCRTYPYWPRMMMSRDEWLAE